MNLLKADCSRVSPVIFHADHLEILQDLVGLLRKQTIGHLQLESVWFQRIFVNFLAALLQIKDDIAERLMEFVIFESIKTKAFPHLRQGVASGSEAGHAQHC